MTISARKKCNYDISDAKMRVTVNGISCSIESTQRHVKRFRSAISKDRQSSPNPNPDPSPSPNPNHNLSMRVLVGFMGREPLGMAALRNGGPTHVKHSICFPDRNRWPRYLSSSHHTISSPHILHCNCNHVCRLSVTILCCP